MSPALVAALKEKKAKSKAPKLLPETPAMKQGSMLPDSFPSAGILEQAGILTYEEVRTKNSAELTALDGIGPKTAEAILAAGTEDAQAAAAAAKVDGE